MTETTITGWLTVGGTRRRFEVAASMWDTMSPAHRGQALRLGLARHLAVHDIRWEFDDPQWAAAVADPAVRAGGVRRVAFDTEFIEDGRSVELVSLALVDVDTGAYYYAVSTGFDVSRLLAHDWLRANVAPLLPWRDPEPDDGPALDLGHPDVKDRRTLAREMTTFIVGAGGPTQLWAHFGAFDHVVLSGLCDLLDAVPPELPIWTHELNHRIEALGAHGWLPRQSAGRHNALADARHLAQSLRRLDEYEASVTVVEPDPVVEPVTGIGAGIG